MIVTALAWSLLHSLWQLTGIGAAVALILHAQHDDNAQRRYATAVVGYALMAWAPIATFAWLVQGAPDPVTGAVLPAAPAATPWSLWLVGAWIAGVALSGARALTDLVRIESLSRSGIAAPPALQASFDRLVAELGAPAIARLRLVSREMSPVAVGFLRPAVLVPAALLTRLSPRELEAVLAHELVHLKRLDYAVNLVQTALDAALFYHPAARWLSARVRDEREEACDAEVVATLGDRVGYARALTAVEAWRLETLTAAPAATGGSLTQRVLRILGRPTAAQRPRWALPGLVVASLVALATGAAAVAQDVRVTGQADVDWAVDGDTLVLEVDGQSIRVPMLSEDATTDVDVRDEAGVQVVEITSTSGDATGDAQRRIHIVQVQGDGPARTERVFELAGSDRALFVEELDALAALENLEVLGELKGLESLGRLEALRELETLDADGWPHAGAVFVLPDGEVHRFGAPALDGLEPEIARALDEAMAELQTSLEAMGAGVDFIEIERAMDEAMRDRDRVERRSRSDARRQAEARTQEQRLRDAEARLRAAERELDEARDALRRAAEAGEAVDL